MDALLDTIKFFIIGFSLGVIWTPLVNFAKMFYHGFREMIHEWNNPRGKE